MKEREKNQSLGFSIQPGGVRHTVKLDAQGLKVGRALGVRSRGSCWEKEANESQVESRPGLGSRDSGQAGAQQGKDQPVGRAHLSTAGA